MENHSFAIGNQVRVTRGKYKDERARIVKLCPQKIKLLIISAGAFEGANTYLKPDQLLLISDTCGIAAPGTPEISARPRRIYAVTNDKDAAESQPHVKESPDKMENPWAVHAAYNPDYHQELGLAIGLVTLEAPGHKSDRQRTMAYKIFGDRLLHFEIPMGCAEKSVDRFQDPNFPPKTYQLQNGRRYELLCSQVKQSKQKGDIPLMKIWIQYVLVSAPGISTINLQTELEAVADFGSETPHKAAARIKLLNSPAVKSNRKDQDFFLIDMNASDFEVIEDATYFGYDKSMGCGYIPRNYIEKFLGSHAIGKRTADIQVRVWCPALGVYKGMLTEKPGIGKIQLTRSMQKLQPSRTKSHLQHACLVISGTGLHPTKTNVYVGNILSGGKEPPESFIPKKLGFMLQTLWRQCGISEETIECYVKKSRNSRGVGLEHANVVGVPDPTDSIPAGHAFIPGFESVEADCVVLNKYPSCGASDIKVLPILKAKPDSMSVSNWDFLRRQNFGKIVFGSPASTSAPPIPAELGVDMDGDLYFICWNEDVIAECKPDVQVSWIRGDDDKTPISRQHNSSWFTDSRDLFFDLRTMARFSFLIKALHKAWKKEHEGETEKDLAKADAYGRAFKQSLDLEKQGKKVYLPKSLWDAIPKTLHGLLCDTEELEMLRLVATPSGVWTEEGIMAPSTVSQSNTLPVYPIGQPSNFRAIHPHFRASIHSDITSVMTRSSAHAEKGTKVSRSSPRSCAVPMQLIEQPNDPRPVRPLLQASIFNHTTPDSDDKSNISLPVVSDYETDYESVDESSDMMSFQSASSSDDDRSPSLVNLNDHRADEVFFDTVQL